MSPTLNAELELGSDTVDLKEMVRTDNRATPTGAAEAPVPPEPAAPRAPTLGAMLKRRLDTYVELARRLTHDSHAPDLHAVGGEMDEVGLESFRSQLARLSTEVLQPGDDGLVPDAEDREVLIPQPILGKGSRDA